MKRQTKIFYGALVATLLMATPFAAQARPFGPCYDVDRPGNGSPQSIAPEKREAFWKLMQGHREQTQPLRDRLWTASRTLDALEGNPKVEPKEIRDLVNEMAALRTQLHEQRKAFADKVHKETGIAMPLGHFGMRQGSWRGHRGEDFAGGQRGFGRRHHERMERNW
jgi:P pilus assembly/Cpx signaling pathway, periplasmic inhibitor/zinc-resistance associated protein